MQNSKSPVGTTDDKSTNVEAKYVCPTCTKPYVGSSLSLSKKELLQIEKLKDLSNIEYCFVVRYFGNDEVHIPYIPLKNYLDVIELLQIAKHEISVLQEAVLKTSQVSQ